jgi:hypothetical protein
MKLNEAPTLTRSMHSAQEDLNLPELFIIYPGTRTYPLSETVSVVPLAAFDEGHLND